MFFGRKNPDKKPQHSPYSQYVSNKVIPNISTQRDAILDTAKKCFPRGLGEVAAQRALISHGHAIAQMIAISIAVNMQNVLKREFKDIEYADCALTAQFIMRLPLRNHREAIDEIVVDWITAFETDINYLIFASDEVMIDLIETGNDRYLKYECASEAIMPDAYFFILVKILKQRQDGEYEPYKMLDHAWVPDMNMMGVLQSNWHKTEIMMNHWIKTVQTIQNLAWDNDLEVWEWW